MMKWQEFKTTLDDVKGITKKEYLLTLAVCILGGIVAGIILSPKKTTIIGNNNGSSGGCCDCEEEWEDDLEE